MTNLISEVTHLKATEQILAKKLDDERLKNMQLNEAVLGLQKKLNDNETTINNAQRSSEVLFIFNYSHMRRTYFNYLVLNQGHFYRIKLRIRFPSEEKVKKKSPFDLKLLYIYNLN